MMCQAKNFFPSLFVLIAISLSLNLPDAQAGVIELAQTGQTSCYTDNGSAASCSGTGQDADTRAGQSWPSPRFVADSLTVEDKLTGLTWTKIAREAGFEYSCFPVSTTTAMTWEQAFVAADCLNSHNYGGYSDWRVPNVVEMQSVLNMEDPKGLEWLDGQGFQNAWGSFWTSTTAKYDETYAYRINYFHPGSISVTKKTDANAVWPVRGSTSGAAALMKTGQSKSYHAADDGALNMGVQWPSPRFEVEDDCIYDVLTGLMWTASMDLGGGDKPFDEAISLAKKGKYCGHTDWRVPNQRELFSMINFGESSNLSWLKSVGFKGAASEQDVWSSSAYSYQSNSVWTLMMKGFSNIYADVKEKRMGYKNRVWLVRSVPPIPPVVSQVVPSQGRNDYPVTIYVNGAAFSEGASVSLGSQALTTYYSSTKQLAAYVPMAISPGTYAVTVTLASGAQAVLNDGFTVLPPTADDLFAYPEEFYSARQIEIIGQPTKLHLLVRRFGGVDPISNLNVRFYKGNSAAGELIGSGTIAQLNPFSSAPVSVDWTPDAQGLVYITAVIDSPPAETNPVTNTVTTAAQVVKLEPTATPVPTKAPTKAAATPTPRPTPTSQIPDQIAPVIDSFTIDGGALNNTNGEMALSFLASDPDVPAGKASGIAWAYYTVWEFFPWANDWYATYDSGWFRASSNSTNTAYYSPGYFSGPRFVSLWVADQAQNVSEPVSRLSNYIKPDDFVIEGESKYYLYPLYSGEAIGGTCYYRWGDADLYLWPPDWQTRGAWSSLYTNPDVVNTVVPVDGYYWMEVYGYQSAAYDLTVGLALFATSMASMSPAAPEIGGHTPKTAPGISMSLPNFMRRLQQNASAFQVQLSSPKNGVTIKGKRVTLKWKPLYLGKGYTIQTSTNGRKWKTAARSKKAKVALQKLLPGKTYYWRVKGVNPLSQSGVWSEGWKFKTKKKAGK